MRFYWDASRSFDSLFKLFQFVSTTRKLFSSRNCLIVGMIESDVNSMEKLDNFKNDKLQIVMKLPS